MKEISVTQKVHYSVKGMSGVECPSAKKYSRSVVAYSSDITKVTCKHCLKNLRIYPNKPIHAKPSLYAFYFEVIKAIGLKYGYNIALHGSMNRDLDLIAIAWEKKVGCHDEMIDEIAETIGGFVALERTEQNPKGNRFTEKPHGRKAYVININRVFEMKFQGMMYRAKSFAQPQYYLDISVIPTI